MRRSRRRNIPRAITKPDIVLSLYPRISDSLSATQLSNAMLADVKTKKIVIKDKIIDK